MRQSSGTSCVEPLLETICAICFCRGLRSPCNPRIDTCSSPLRPIEDHDAPDLSGSDGGGRDIERALALLVEDQRHALLLVVLEGLSYREVAEVQGVPIGTVMSRLARARAQIKTYLDGGRPALRRVK